MFKPVRKFMFPKQGNKRNTQQRMLVVTILGVALQIVAILMLQVI